ncbi:hypothetical protein SAMN05444008_10492 [Cnuella takakiae]|uniref:Uncharacterized protein n=1 Tax=Cnuella takakiae TaxID=1302690 RepID=A0A1M4XYN0_9BACT|nr:hypothetical protein [Cnuella takakiae]OLY92992.1 hypothetical protein BUE76_14635 [Cnuella takakiae]SHE98667.1 hypothetical protein SAMN05444008_10492 [Cnuella takakiae]
MKKLILLHAAILFLLNATAQKQRPAINNSKADFHAGVRLQSSSAYPAKAGNTRLGIADPTINALNGMGNGIGVPVYGSNGVLGLPKGTYGYAKGQLWLRSTDATSIGGITGNPSVGTGSSSAGAGGNMLGLNGKSPYAGPANWGSAQGLRQPDSVLRRSRQIGMRQ